MPFGELETLINEQILAEWIDTETATTCALGSCSLFNRQTTNFSMKVSIEPETGQIYIYFSLVVSVRVSTGSRKKEMLVIFLPRVFQNDLEFPLAFESLKTSSLTSLSFLNPSTIQEANLTNLGHIIRVRFDLLSHGSVVIPEAKGAPKPDTATSRDLFLGVKSLSTALRFNVYMRHSDYAIHGLRTLNQRLHETTVSPLHINLVGIYDGRNAMFMEWESLESDDRQQKPHKYQPPVYSEDPLSSLAKAQFPQVSITGRQPPPSYAEGPVTPFARVQVSQSPPITGREESLQNVVVETPPQTLVYDNAIPPTASPTSDHSFLDIREELENEIDPDEEYYAILHARESSLAREEVASTTLLSEVTTWLAGAMTISNDIYKHKRLSSRLLNLGYHARTLNTTALNATKIWCSTILFYDPEDSIPELWSPANRWLISDMAELIQWSNTLSRSPEMCLPHIRCEFVKLGSAAQSVALQPQCDTNLAGYKHQRAHCLAVVLFEFGRPGVSEEEQRSR